MINIAGLLLNNLSKACKGKTHFSSNEMQLEMIGIKETRKSKIPLTYKI